MKYYHNLYLSDELKEKYGELLKERLARLSQKL